MRRIVVISILLLVVSTFTAGVNARPEAGSASSAVFNVGFHGDVPVARGDSFHGGTVLAVNDAVSFALVRSHDAAAFHQEAGQDDRVRYVEVDRAVIRPHLTPNDPLLGDQWAWNPTPGIDAYSAWDVTLGSTSIIVAVIDSGYAQDHEDLPTPVDQYDLVDDDPIAEPTGGACDGHGTHTAGTVGAVTGNGVGVAGTAQVGLMPLKVFQKQGGCGATFSAITNAVTYAADNGAHVITMSLGCNGCSSNALNDALDYAWNQNVLIVASSGNSGPCNDCVGYPASHPNVMAVTALSSDGKVTSWSSTGPEVEISAPGASILSTVPGGYATYSGTSMAAPHVAGVAALVLSNETLSNTDLRERLKTTAVDLGFNAQKQGAGAVNAALALGTTAGDGGSTNAKPTASFTFSCTDLACDFDASSSVDTDGSIVSYAWDFGDGNTASGATVSHTYASGGTYTVTLTVTDDGGATDAESKSVSVSTSTGDGGTMHVHDIDNSNRGPHVFVTFWVYTSDDAPVSGASVSVEVCQEGGPCATGTGTTGDDGTVTFQWKHVGSGTYTSCVTDLTHATLTWDSTADHAASGSCETETV